MGVQAGGFVADGRVNASLNLSRALGDLEYKQSSNLGPEEQMVTAVPEIRRMRLQPGDDFLLLACDGIWDVLTNQEVCSELSSLAHHSRGSLCRPRSFLLYNHKIHLSKLVLPDL